MRNTLPILYSFRRCPYAIRARFALLYAEIEWQHHEVDLKNKPPEMLAASPKGTVPVLILSDATVIDESYDIMRWALKQNDPGYFYPSQDVERIDAWVKRNDEDFKPILDGYKYPEGKERSQEEYRDLGLDWFNVLAGEMSYGRLLGRPSLADIALFPFVRQFRGVDPDWFDAHAPDAVQDWLNSYLKSATFEEVMSKEL